MRRPVYLASLHLNLRGMVKFGISPVDALKTATSNAGAFLNEPMMAPFAAPAHSTVRNHELPARDGHSHQYWETAAYVETGRASCCADHWHPQLDA